TVVTLIPEHQVVLLGPLVEEVGVALPREAHTTVDLEVLPGEEHGRLTNEALAHGSGSVTRRVVDIRGPGRVVRTDARQLQPVQHVDGLVANGLETRERAVELHAHLGVLNRLVERLLTRPDELGRERNRGIVDDAPPEPRVVTRRTDRYRAALVHLESRGLARRVERGHGLRVGEAVDEEGAEAVL